MSLWVWILLLATLIKLPIAAAMIWIPFRYDNALQNEEPQDSSEEDGGSRALPAGPLDPHPRSPRPRHPRRGPHGSPAPSPPSRVRLHAPPARRHVYR
jgi:hypothetical protein